VCDARGRSAQTYAASDEDFETPQRFDMECGTSPASQFFGLSNRMPTVTSMRPTTSSWALIRSQISAAAR
jgi:hypothetical protein